MSTGLCFSTVELRIPLFTRLVLNARQGMYVPGPPYGSIMMEEFSPVLLAGLVTALE